MVFNVNNIFYDIAAAMTRQRKKAKYHTYSKLLYKQYFFPK